MDTGEHLESVWTFAISWSSYKVISKKDRQGDFQNIHLPLSSMTSKESNFNFVCCTVW